MTDRIILRGSESQLKTAITNVLAIHQLIQQKDIGSIYGIPSKFYQEESLVFVPQITLHFKEDIDDIELGFPQVEGEINFRITGETDETLSEANLRTIANKIKINFGASNGFVWQKGKVRCNYADKGKGYFLQILSRSTTAGKSVIQNVLSLQNHTPEWNRLNVSENEQPTSAFPVIPPTKKLLNKNRRMPRRRPIADVRFTKAVCHVYGIPDPILLYDCTRLNSNALVT